MKYSGHLFEVLLLSLLSTFIGCGPEAQQGGDGVAKGQLIVAITPLSHPSLDQSFEGFVQGVREKGLSESDVRIEPMNASGDFTRIPSLVKNALAKDPAALFVVTTPAAAEAIKITESAGVPLLYTAVTDPVAAKIVTSMEHSHTLATGVSDRYPVEEQMRIFRILLPEMKTAAFLYNPSEENSQILVRKSIDALEKQGVQSERYEVHNANEIPSQAKQALASADCVIVNGDNLITENLSTVANLCRVSKKPLFVGDPDSVRKGAIATVGPSYFEIGRRTGHKAAQILKGKSAGDIPSEFPRAFDYIINTEAAKAMGLVIPPDFWASREIWESKSASTK